MSARHRPLSAEACQALFEVLPVVPVAWSTPEGPRQRPLHPVVFEGGIWFHGRRSPEREAALGSLASAVAFSPIATLPSWFFHPERPCPATTWYESALAEGPLVAEEDRARKAAILNAFMVRHQPEGRYVPLTAEHDAGPLDGILVYGIAAPRWTGRAKAGFHLSEEKLLGVLTQLWRRGEPGDIAAIDRIRAWNPDLPAPSFLAAPLAVRLAPGAAEAEAVSALLADTYWNLGVSHAARVAAQRASTAWIVLQSEGRVVASARALADGRKWAWIYDVVVAPEARGQGLGRALMRILLDHPALRGCARVCLGTRDAMEFYTQLGFVRKENLPPRSFVSYEMVKLNT